MPRSLAVLALTLSLTDAQGNLPCFTNFGNSSFNLAPYRSGTSTGYSVIDSLNNANSRNYTYFFDFCKNVDPTQILGPQPYFTNPNWFWPSCNCTVGYSTSLQTPPCVAQAPGGAQAGPTPGDGSNWGPAPAFQVSMTSSRWRVPNNDMCHRLGSTLGPTATSTSFLLLDSTNPSRGVGIKYSGGDTCALGGPSRSLTVWLQCEDDNSNKPDDEPVLETGSCAYEIFVKTLYGCPLECGGLTNGRLCTGHGICDYDTSVKSSRCFCNDGFSGDDCSISGAAGGSGLSALASVLIVVVIFLVGTLGFLGFLWYRIRSLRLDPAAYSALRAGPEESDKASLNAPAFSSA